MGRELKQTCEKLGVSVKKINAWLALARNVLVEAQKDLNEQGLLRSLIPLTGGTYSATPWDGITGKTIELARNGDVWVWKGSREAQITDSALLQTVLQEIVGAVQQLRCPTAS